MKICFDVNVVLDMMARSALFPDSYFAYDVANLRHFESFVTAAEIPTLVYLLQKCDYQEKTGHAVAEDIFSLFDILDTTGTDCKRAHKSKMPDYEDALIAETTLRNGIDLILTRNIKDFTHSPVKAILPKDFVHTFKPDNFEYDLTELD